MDTDKNSVQKKLQTLKDPVCGMTVTTQSMHHLKHDNKIIYFCSVGCKTQFKDNPDKYSTLVADAIHSNITGFEKVDMLRKPLASLATAAPVIAITGIIYTCPMHPEVRQNHPGNCPKCGMILEAEMPTLEEGESAELIDFKRRFYWTLPLTIIVTFLAMAGHRLNWFSMSTQSWVELVLSLPIVLWAGRPFFVRGFQSLIHRSPNMWTLIGLGTGAAFIYSVVATVAPQLFPSSFIAMGG